jgi:hypothetical protein
MAASFTVFLCSTFSDLSAERREVLGAISRLKLQHDSMEFFGARAEQPIETCLREVRASDILVVIVGHKYGSVVPNLGISYSESEYVEAYRLQKFCLVYMRDENVPILPRHMERDPEKLKLLERWKEELQSRHTVASFQDGPGLAIKVAKDLERTIRELQEVAQARAGARTTSDTALFTEVENLILEALSKGVQEPSLLSAVRSTVFSLLATVQKREPTVFLSYAHTDSSIVRRVAEGLTAAGVRAWSPEVELKPGVDWLLELERELSIADFVVFFISPESVESPWVSQEMQIALHRKLSGEGGAVVLPVLLRDADVPPLLRQFRWVDLRDGDIERGIGELVDTIRQRPVRQFVR